MNNKIETKIIIDRPISEVKALLDVEENLVEIYSSIYERTNNAKFIIRKKDSIYLKIGSLLLTVKFKKAEDRIIVDYNLGSVRCRDIIKLEEYDCNSTLVDYVISLKNKKFLLKLITDNKITKWNNDFKMEVLRLLDNKVIRDYTINQDEVKKFKNNYIKNSIIITILISIIIFLVTVEIAGFSLFFSAITNILFIMLHLYRKFSLLNKIMKEINEKDNIK